MKKKPRQQRQAAPEPGKQRKKKPEEKRQDSDDIERAVFDGMQDLRGENDKGR